MQKALTFDLPEEIIAVLGSSDEAAIRAREALLLDLLRDGTVSRGQVASALGISIWDVLDLIREHRIPSGPESAEEARREFEEAQQALRRP